MDAVINGKIVYNVPTDTVMVADETERDLFTNIKPVGTYAATWGFTAAWQLCPGGTWKTVFDRRPSD